MRLGLLVVLPLILGTSLGTGLTWYEYRDLTNHFEGVEDEEALSRFPKAVVINKASFDFGSMGHQQTSKHTFTIQNAGGSMLELKMSDVSCGQCVETQFTSASVQPGQTTDVEVTFHTRKPGPYYSERVELSSNDPAQDIVSLEIRGYVTRTARVSTEEIVVGSVSANDVSRANFRVYGFQDEPIQIISHEMLNKANASFFEIESKPLEPAEVAGEKYAKSGRLVTLVVKPGLPVGAINQTIRLVVKSGEEANFELPVYGNIASDISVVGGTNFRSDINLLEWGTVQRSQGAKAALRVLIKGPYRRDVQLSIAKVDPPEVIHAELGQRTEIANGAIFSQTLTVTLPPGSPIVNRLGTDQGRSAHVILNSTHPTAKVIDIRVRFATE